MPEPNHKAIRRTILRILYDTYLRDPLCMVEPERFYESSEITRETIIPNIHYLSDRHLVEMMMGYQPPMFSAARITTQGIDLVENRFEFDRQFPAPPGAANSGLSSVPRLLEQLVVEGDFVAVDGIARKQILSDILYLREELSLPDDRWRPTVIAAVMNGIEAICRDCPLASLAELRQAILPPIGGSP